MDILTIGIPILLYMIAVVLIGHYATRRTRRNTEDYFVAGRTFSTLVLFCSAIGTQLSAFVLLGFPGAVYHMGIGMYGLIAATGLVICPYLFYIGYRAWLVARVEGHITPSQLYGLRFGETFGFLLFLVLVLWTLPYVMLGMVGGGRAIVSATQGAVPYWVGALVVTLIVGYYVVGGGMRGTAWTNVFQVLVFVCFIILLSVWFPSSQGGPAVLTERVLAERPHLMQRGGLPAVTQAQWITQWFIFGFGVFAFPQFFVRLFTARNGAVLKRVALIYPVPFLVVFLPVTMLALWGAVSIPGLRGAESDAILMLLTAEFLPAWMTGLALAAVLAFLMSTLDAQTLTLSSMFTIDLVQRHFGKWRKSEAEAVRIGQGFVILFLVAAYVLALFNPAPIYSLLDFAITGYFTAVPIMIAGLYSRRITGVAANVSLLLGTLLVFFFHAGAVPRPLGLGPGIPIALVQIITIVAVSRWTRQDPARVDRFFRPIDAVFRRK